MMKDKTVRIFWSIFLICMLEMVSWSLPMGILVSAQSHDDINVAKNFFQATTAHMSALEFPNPEESLRQAVEEAAPSAIQEQHTSASQMMAPSFLLLGASLSLAVAGGMCMSGPRQRTVPARRFSSSSSSVPCSDDDSEGAPSSAALPSTSSGAKSLYSTPSSVSPLFLAGAALSVAASIKNRRLVNPSRLFSSSRPGQAVPPLPQAPLRSPASSAEPAASSKSPAGPAFSAQQQQLLRDVLKGADNEIIRSLRSGSLEAEQLHQTVADILADAVRPRAAAGAAKDAHDSPAASAAPLAKLTDKAILDKLRNGEVQQHQLEHAIGDLERAVYIRRKWFVHQEQFTQSSVSTLPFENYDYQKVVGACCENVLGYVPIPVGLAGPVTINGESVPLPMATTEGCLVASTHRGTKAINESGGATASILADGMTRAPVVRMPTAADAARLKNWIDAPENYQKISESFNSTSRFARVLSIKASVAGCAVYLRFKAKTGDAMGMNMISKGVEKALSTLRESFPEMSILALSGNMCTDKKPSAINWVEGRGKSVVVEAIIKGDIVKKVLKTTVNDMITLNQNKNLIGSAMAG
ncbi:MAG: hydroxymethylglutaryl-CoA reductase, partial [archaeon]|nr:hydroxymethylglutaryl-CoA reductase [archaeon]